MNVSSSTKIASAAAFAALIATTALASAFPGQKLASQASVTIVDARAAAIKAVPGKIVSQELEKEAGGSGLRYTFDIKTAHGVREVGIDAKSGAVLENSAETDATTSATPDKGEGPEGSGD